MENRWSYLRYVIIWCVLWEGATVDMAWRIRMQVAARQAIGIQEDPMKKLMAARKLETLWMDFLSGRQVCKRSPETIGKDEISLRGKVNTERWKNVMASKMIVVIRKGWSYYIRLPKSISTEKVERGAPSRKKMSLQMILIIIKWGAPSSKKKGLQMILMIKRTPSFPGNGRRVEAVNVIAGYIHHRYAGGSDMNIILEWLERILKERAVSCGATLVLCSGKPFYTSKYVAQTKSCVLCCNGKSSSCIEVEANFKQVAGKQRDFPSTAQNLFGLDLVEVSKHANTQPPHREQSACISTPERQMESTCLIPKEDIRSRALTPKDEKEVLVPEDVQYKVSGIEAYIVKDDVKVLVVENDQNTSTGLEDGQGQVPALYSNSNSGRCKRYFIVLAFRGCLLVPVVLMTVYEGSAKELWARNDVTSRVVAIQIAWYDAQLKDRFLHISISQKWRMQGVAWGDQTEVANSMIEQLQNRCYLYAQEMRQTVPNLVMKSEDVYSKYRIENVAGRLSNREDSNANISNNQAHVLSYNTSIFLNSRVSELEETRKTKLVYEDSQDARMYYWTDWAESFLFVCSNPTAKLEQDFMKNHFVEHSIQDLEAPAEASQCDVEGKSKRSISWFFGSSIILMALLRLVALLLHGNGKRSQPRKAKEKEANVELIIIHTNGSPYGSFTALERVVENKGDCKVQVYRRQLFWQEKKVHGLGIGCFIWSQVPVDCFMQSQVLIGCFMWKVLIGCFMGSQMMLGCLWFMMSRAEVVQEIQVDLKLVTVTSAVGYLAKLAKVKVYFGKDGSLWHEKKAHGLRIIEQGLCTRPMSNGKQKVVSLDNEFLGRIGLSLKSNKSLTQALNFKMQGESIGFWFKDWILTKLLHHEIEYMNLMHMLRIQPGYGAAGAYRAMKRYAASGYSAARNSASYGAAGAYRAMKGYAASGYGAAGAYRAMKGYVASGYGAAGAYRAMNDGAANDYDENASGLGAGSYGATSKARSVAGAYRAMNEGAASSYGEDARYGVAPYGYISRYSGAHSGVYGSGLGAGNYGATSKARNAWSANRSASVYPSGGGASNYGAAVWGLGATTRQNTASTSEYSSYTDGQTGGSYASNRRDNATRGQTGMKHQVGLL